MVKLQENQIPTLSDVEAMAISKLKEKISEYFHVKEIILFGSKARGDFEKDSDVDLLVLVSETDDFPNRSLLSDITFEVNMEFGTILTCLLRNHEKWSNGIGEYTAFIQDVSKEGISIEL